MAESLGRLYLMFLRFGALAWGGPPAQIGMLRDELVDERRWMDRDQFHRTLAVYQALPGPEAHELCVHVGMVRRGRPGAIVAGLGFMTPGLVLMLLLSWLYVTYGIQSAIVAGLFTGIPAAVAALVTRATIRLGQGALTDTRLAAVAALCGLATLAGAPFLLVLACGAVAGALQHRSWALTIPALVAAVFIVQATIQPGVPGFVQPGDANQPSLTELAASGARTGLLTFGGAYTALPFLERDAVGGGWMTAQAFADGVGLVGIIPTPLIMLGAFVGYQAGGLLGSLAMTATIFLPAFLFTLIGYRYFAAVIAMPRLSAALRGITAAAIGLIGVTALGLVVSGVVDPLGIGVFLVALTMLTHWHHRAAIPVVIACAGLAGLLTTL